MSLVKSIVKFFDELYQRGKIVLLIIAWLWIIHLIGYLVPIRQYGVHPREISGLPGIVIAPFLHADFNHLLANSLSLAIFASLLILIERRNFFAIVLLLMVITGALTWLLARSANHIGASGVIFGMFSYLLVCGYFRREIQFIAISILVLLLYGSMIYGVMPTSAHISWESHLFGFIAGIVVAGRYYRIPFRCQKRSKSEKKTSLR